MAATATWSPTSLQLRLATNSRYYYHCYCRIGSPATLIRVGVRKLDVEQVRVLCLAQNGNGKGKGKGERCRNRIGSSVSDDFAGWSDSDNGDQSTNNNKSIQSESQTNKWVGGAVAAGVIFVAGLAFASFSLNNPTTSRPKQQMEPFTSQQEVSLASDPKDDRVEENISEERESNDSSLGLESKTGTHLDFPSSPQLYEAPNQNKLADSNEVNISSVDNIASYTTGCTDIVNNASVQEDLQYQSTSDDKSVAPEMTPTSQNPYNSEIVDSLTTNVPKSTSEIEQNSVDIELANSSQTTNLNTDHWGGLPGLNLNETFDTVLDSSNSDVHEPCEPVAVTVLVSSPVDAILEPHTVPTDNVVTVTSLSTKENLDLTNTPTFSTEGNCSSMETNYLNESGSSGTMSASASDISFSNEQDLIVNNEVNESRSFFSSPTPESSFSSAGIPAPSVVSAALQVLPGKVLVPAVVDPVQGQALVALQALKVIEPDVQPCELCTRREYARWLVAASSALSRSTVSKVYPAMYIEDVTELAFDDITHDDPDFSSIQGLAEAGLISSKLSSHDLLSSSDEAKGPFYFSSESPLSRQDLVSWKMALERRQLPEADKKILYQLSGFRDIDKINPDAWPALVADLSAGEQGITSLAFGCTRLFQPDKPVTKAQAAVALATGEASDVVGEELARIEAESMAENAVSAHNALVAQVEQDINASFEKELSMEREKINAVEKMAEEARHELERLRAEREEDNLALMKERAAIESEMELLSRLRREVEEQLQSVMSNKVEISYEKDRISKLQKEAEHEKQEISRLQYELEVERKALSMARGWAEDEAKRAGEQAKALEEARDRWERHGIKVVVDGDLCEESSTGVTWLTAGKQVSVEGTVSRAKNLVDRLKLMADNVVGKSREVIDKIIQKIRLVISVLKDWASKVGTRAEELKDTTLLRAKGSIQELRQNTTEFSLGIKDKAMGSIQGLQQNSVEFGLAVKEGAMRVAGDCREGVEKLTQKFKS